MSNPVPEEKTQEMTQDQILLQVQSLMSELFGLPAERVTLEAHLVNDLDLDSLDAIDMAVKLQEMTGYRVDEGAVKSIRTVADVVQLVQTILARQPAATG